jgi:hypothetical protein
MAVKLKVERPIQTIKTNVSPVSSDLKLKMAAAIQGVVNEIKTTHL